MSDDRQKSLVTETEISGHRKVWSAVDGNASNPGVKAKQSENGSVESASVRKEAFSRKKGLPDRSSQEHDVISFKLSGCEAPKGSNDESTVSRRFHIQRTRL